MPTKLNSSIDLSKHIDRLRSKDPSPTDSSDRLLFWGSSYKDKPFLPYLKSCVGSETVFIRLEEVSTLTMVQIYCKQKHITRVISCSVSLLKKVLKWEKRAAPSLSDYAGSYFTIPGFKDSPEIEIVFVPPVKQLATVAHGQFITKRLISKLTKREQWYKATEFNGWDLLSPENEAALYQDFFHPSVFLISVDIETFKENATIRCISYTAFLYGGDGNIYSISVVLPLDSEYNLSIMRKWNLLPAPKVLQNGKYDCAYLTRYNAPLYNYLYDTANLFHCWYSELPKDLGFLNAFFIREAVYWKDLSETNDLHEYYKYNALDTWGTGNAFLAMILEAPKYAIDNYLLEFPVTFPCHLAEMTGIDRELEAFERARKEQEEIRDKYQRELDKTLGTPEGEVFNVKSPKQKKALFKVLGCGDLKSQDEKNIKKAIFRHPFNARILRLVLKVIKARTLISNYLTPGKEFHRLDGTGNRYLFALNPHGTDSGRLASKSHHFWCGDNIQKIKRGKIVKQTFKSDPGFLFAEVDLEQAESRDTGYISGDKQLIYNVEHSPDFHCANASKFFGIPFDELYDIATGKKLNVKIRDIAKNVNHGANYNMGAYVLVDTMGEENIAKARRLLGLNRFWTSVQVADYLLDQFHKTFPGIKEVFYKGVTNEVMKTSKLMSMAYHHSWDSEEGYIDSLKKTPLHKDAYDVALRKSPRHTRYCFGDPTKSKTVLNSYIAHPPQNLNGMTLNKAYLLVFHDIAMNEKHSDNFKLGPQIHDSIFFQYRIDHDYLCDMVKERMEIPITIKGYDGKIRTFVVPAGIKKGDHLEGEKKGKARYWSETE